MGKISPACNTNQRVEDAQAPLLQHLLGTYQYSFFFFWGVSWSVCDSSTGRSATGKILNNGNRLGTGGGGSMINISVQISEGETRIGLF